MKRILILLISFAFFCFVGKAQKKVLDNTFYVFNNCTRTLPNAPESMLEQAKLVKELGYDGFAGHASEDYWQRRKALDKVGLKMPEIYWGLKLTDDGKITYNEEIKKIIKDSKERNLLVAFVITGKNSNGDQLVANEIRDLAEFAKSFGVKVAIYPHVNTFVETVAHSIKLAEMIDRDNAGVIFNTCHLLKAEGEEAWQEKALAALPYIYMVSINGADSGDTQNMGWDRLIQPLGEGTFDTYQLVKLLKDNGYQGLFGLQCYNINQDCRKALKKSITTWRNFQKKFAKE